MGQLEKQAGLSFAPPPNEPEWLRRARADSWARYQTRSASAEPAADQWRHIKLADMLSGVAVARPCARVRPGFFPFDDYVSVRWTDDVATRPPAVVGGVRLVSFVDAAADDAAVIQAMAREDETRADACPLASLHYAVFGRGLFIDVPPKMCAAKPLTILHDANTDPAVNLVFIRVGADSLFQLMDVHSGDAALTAHYRLVCLMEPGAQVVFASAQESGPKTRLYHHHHFDVRRQASLKAHYLPIGGELTRVDQKVYLREADASAHTSGFVFGHRAQIFEFHADQMHLAPRTTSDLFFRNVVADRARSIFVGNAVVAPSANAAAAFQTNKNLLLSDAASAITEPKLEIMTEDVSCGHGATVSTLDENELFYLKSRGLDHAGAARLMIGGFVAEAAARLPAGQIRTKVNELLARRIDAVISTTR